mmetsp:Transcript_44134/g.69009  ORF Transcript_44134/g.69009 Transcript_44134/m.69009 type:complete len:411 (+) Transcript_44134:166-1398(+)
MSHCAHPNRRQVGRECQEVFSELQIEDYHQSSRKAEGRSFNWAREPNSCWQRSQHADSSFGNPLLSQAEAMVKLWRIGELEHRLQSQHRDIDDLRKQLTAKDERIRTRDKKVQESEQQIASLKEQLGCTTREVEDQRRNFNKKAAEEFKHRSETLRSQLASQRVEINQKEETIAALKAKIEACSKGSSELLEKHHGMEKEISRQNKVIQKQRLKIQQLKPQIKQLELERSNLQELKSTMEKDHLKRGEILSEKTSEIEKLVSRINDLERDVTLKGKKLNRCESVNKQLQASEKRHEIEVQESNYRISSLESENKSLLSMQEKYREDQSFVVSLTKKLLYSLEQRGQDQSPKRKRSLEEHDQVLQSSTKQPCLRTDHCQEGLEIKIERSVSDLPDLIDDRGLEQVHDLQRE